MSDQELSEIEDTIRFVSDVARCRYPWLSSLREPTDVEFRIATLVVERYPTEEQLIDRTGTKKLVIQ